MHDNADEPTDELLDDLGLQPAPELDLPAGPADALELVVGPFALADDDVRAAVCMHVTSEVDGWRARVQEARSEAARTPDFEIGDISLIAHGDRVMFFHWSDRLLWVGRPVTIWGSNNKIQSMVPARVKAERVGGSRLIISKVPAPMLRVARFEAASMPDWCMLLNKLENAQIFCGPLDVSSPSPPLCVVCTAHPTSASQSMNFDLYRCISCTTDWHMECARSWSADLHDSQFADAAFVCPCCCRHDRVGLELPGLPAFDHVAPDID